MDFAPTPNKTHTEKRSTPMEINSSIDCKTVTYKKVTLQDFVYKYKCFPEGWKTSLEDISTVKKETETISKELEGDAKNMRLNL